MTLFPSGNSCPQHGRKQETSTSSESDMPHEDKEVLEDPVLDDTEVPSGDDEEEYLAESLVSQILENRDLINGTHKVYGAISSDAKTSKETVLSVRKEPYVRQVAAALDGDRKTRTGAQKAKAPKPIPMAARVAKWQRAASQTAVQPIRETPSVVSKWNAKGIRYF